MDAENVTSLELYPYIRMDDASHSTYLYGIMDAKVSLQFLVLRLSSYAPSSYITLGWKK